MGPLDFQGRRDNTVEMDMLEKRETQGCLVITKMRPQVIKGLLDHQAPLAERDLGGPQAWDFLAPQEREGNQEHQAGQATGVLMVGRVRKVIQFLVT